MKKSTSKPKASTKASVSTGTSTGKPQPMPLPQSPKELAKLKLVRLSGDESLAARLVKAGLISFRRLAVIPRETLLNRLGDRLTKSEQRTLYTTQRNAQRMAVYVADQATDKALALSPNAMWLFNIGGKKPGRNEFPCHCGCCDSIFSLKAYLFDLLDLLQHYWDIDVGVVETLLQRSFSALHLFDPRTLVLSKSELTCEALNAPLPQARIAVEVLEAYLGRSGTALPTNDATHKEKFLDRLLRLITPQEVQIQIFAHSPAAASLTVADVEAQMNLLTTDLPGDDERTRSRRAMLRHRLQPFAQALAAWKAKLNTLVLNLAGIDEAVSLLSDYSQNFTGFAPNTLLTTLPEDASDDQKRILEVTQKFEQGRDATMRQWLVDYRDTLHRATGKKLETLEASLFISLSSGACRTTTRMQELVTSVQQIVENIRSGEMATVDRPDLPSGVMSSLRATGTLPLAETAWERLRDYETWLGYMYGWVYPENVLNPILVATETPPSESNIAEVAGVLLDSSVNPRAIEQGYFDLLFPDTSVIASQTPGAALFPFRWNTDSLSDWVQRLNTLWTAVGSTVEVSRFAKNLLFPLLAGSQLNRSQQFAVAHEWYRLLYDPDTGRSSDIFDSFTGEVTNERSGTRWLNNPFDPVSIANRRQGVWLRYTILAMVRNLIDWADDDFARGLPDTYQRAEERYELARKVLGAQELESECETITLDIFRAIGKGLGMTTREASRYAAPLLQLRSIATLKTTAKSIEKALQGKRSITQKRASVSRVIANARNLDRREHPPRSLKTDWAGGFKEAFALENASFFQPGPGGLAGTSPALGPALVGPIDEPPVFSLPTKPPFAPITVSFCVPLNPVVNLLRRQIDNQLSKLQHCLDFVGEPQIPRVYGCDTYDATTGLINRPTTALNQLSYAIDQPRYRYAFLVEKSRQYVDVAQRMGSLLLQAVQNRDNEAFQQLRAEHAIEVAGATVELRRLGQIEASHGVEIAELQSDRADSQVEFWDRRAGGDIDDVWDSLSDAEMAGMILSGVGTALSVAAVLPGAAMAGIGAGIAAAGLVISASGAGAPVGVPAALAGLVVGAGGLEAALIAGGAGAASSASTTALTYASFERRFEDWKNQFNLAKFDAQIAALQVTLANDRVAIADQEMVIAQLQLSHAREELRFLQTKTTNVVFYDWMIRVLSRDYRTLMQIAACVARMAQRALEFERQESVRIILGDYWNVAADVIESRNLTERQRSLGLLGAERLLTDLTKLDAFRLATERRRQQISKTISLARLTPIELVEFRRSGNITFNTLMEWFDDDFQGHYLRLIKSVKVTVLAIVPPIDGIHAMLQNTGESSVVVTEDAGLSFTKKRALRNFGERISLDAPFNESGLFVLNYEDPMLLPFEGLGVETQWTLELPLANNRFHFDTIADVLLTIDYTAEHSLVYEKALREARRGVAVHEDTTVPLRLQFPDAWYHLKNQRKDPATGNFLPFSFKFHLPRTAFAPNLLDPITVAHLTLLVSGDLTAAEQGLVADGITISHTGTTLKTLHKGLVPRPAPAGSPAGTPGTAGDPNSAFGYPVFGLNSLLLSTRGNSANGLQANPQIGTATPDEWTIDFPAAVFPAVVDKIWDILLIITVQGRRA